MNILNSNIGIKDFIEVIIAVIIGYSSYKSAKISKRVEEGINKINNLQVYNKQRKGIAKTLEGTLVFIEDVGIDITNITYISKIQSAISRVELYSTLLSKDELDKINNIKKTIRLDSISSTERKLLLEEINYFIAKLLKGDVLI